MSKNSLINKRILLKKLFSARQYRRDKRRYRKLKNKVEAKNE